MDLERWKRIDEIFHAVLDHEPSVRAQFLAEACEGDDSLRIELERLIACHEKESTLFDRPPSDLATALLAKQDTYMDTISHYRILKKIGRGGMGEVYLAEDTRLNRKVALKLLPLEFTKDKDRIRRFEHEARAVSALNHPNILTIHDIGETESSSFIATEYIDGESLRQRMRVSKVQLKEVLTIVIQIAEALDAAHQAGIIHRDIKPENIMLRKDGYVKVLDFGLAKLTEPDTGASDLETSTQKGIMMGTVRYMSPEQARGLKLDPRSDIFSLGVVLYELIAGHPPFEGATSSDVIAAILEKNPPALRTFGMFPEELQWIVTKALVKDPEERYQTIKELLTDLKRVKKRLEIDEQPKNSDGIAQPVLSTRKWAVLVSLVLVTLAAVILLLVQRDKRETPTSGKPFSKIKLTRLTSSGKAWGGTISPDGKYVAYFQERTPGERSLYLKQLAADSEIQLLTPPPETFFYGYCRFSHDGEYLYYLTWQPSVNNIGSLYQIPVLGGIPRKVIEDIETVPAISPDGKKLAFVRKGKQEALLMTAHVDGSEQRKIASHRDVYGGLAWSPDGKIVTTILYNRALGFKQIGGIHLDDGVKRPLFDMKWSSESPEYLEWLSDGSGLVLTKGIAGKLQVCFVSYPKGELTSITNDFNDYSGISLTKDFKSLLTSQVSFTASLWMASSTDPDAVTQITSGSDIEDGNTGLSWTPDGKILYRSYQPSGDYQLYSINSDGTGRKQITTGQPDKHWPIASPDGRSIVYNTLEDEGATMRIWRMNADGSDPKVISQTLQVRWPRYSPDSKWIVYSSSGGGEKQTLIKLKLDEAKESILASHLYLNGGAVSPDGSQIAYVYNDSEESPDFGMNIISSENGAVVKTIRLDGNAVPYGRIHWTPDGRGISYLVHKDDVSNIYIQPTDGSPARKFTNFTTDLIGNYSWSMDGKQIAYSRGKESNYDIVLIESLP